MKTVYQIRFIVEQQTVHDDGIVDYEGETDGYDGRAFSDRQAAVKVMYEYVDVIGDYELAKNSLVREGDCYGLDG